MVVPTSRRTAFDFVMTSGMRNEPPISTSSPRETMTSPPSASVFSASRTAAALLLTTMVETLASCARAGPDGVPHSRQQLAEQAVHVDIALAPLAGLDIELQVRITRGGFADVFQRGRRQRRAPQIGVQDHSGGVDYGGKRITATACTFALGLHSRSPRAQIAGRQRQDGLRQSRLRKRRQNRANGVRQQPRGLPAASSGANSARCDKLIDGGNLAVQVRSWKWLSPGT